MPIQVFLSIILFVAIGYPVYMWYQGRIKPDEKVVYEEKNVKKVGFPVVQNSTVSKIFTDYANRDIVITNYRIIEKVPSFNWANNICLPKIKNRFGPINVWDSDKIEIANDESGRPCLQLLLPWYRGHRQPYGLLVVKLACFKAFC